MPAALIVPSFPCQFIAKQAHTLFSANGIVSLSVLALFLCYTAWNFSISNFDSVTQDMTMQVTERPARAW